MTLTRSNAKERGASALLVAASLVMLMGFAAVAIDLGAAFNERRQDQTGADIGVMAGSIELLNGSASMRDQALTFARNNLDTTYSDAEWQSSWEACTDPGRNAGGFSFIALPPPAGWTVTDPANWCVSLDPAGFLRVNLPDQVIDTTFGRVLGSNQISTSAAAVARFAPRAGGGILPFGLLASASEGQTVCLQTAPGGLAEPPCDGPSSGNFGVIESPFYGNPAIGTTQNCTGSPKNDVLAVNIAAGLDHLVLPDPDGIPGNERLDTCAQIGTGNPPDTLFMQTGNPSGSAEGIAEGPVNFGLDPRLQQGANPKASVHGLSLDNRPAWYYLDGALTVPAIPASCVKSTFDNGTAPPFDWDTNGTLDSPESWEHMAACLKEYSVGSYSAVMFVQGIADSSRFAYVPQFWENTWPPGVSQPRHIKRYKASWLQGTWWKKGGTIREFNPGEGGAFPGNASMIQLSSLVIPDASLPESLRGDPPPNGGLNPFLPELYR